MRYNIVITAGGTSEPIDEVRKITNSASGKLGMVIANKLLEKEEMIDTIYYICSKNSYKPENRKVKIIEILDTNDLERNVRDVLTNNKIDYFIHSMAVSDYTVDYVTTAGRLAKYLTNHKNEDLENLICNNEDTIKEKKISSNEGDLMIKLKKTPKIISIIKKVDPKVFLVGFKLLDDVKEDELINVAINIKDKNNCDLVVANDLKNIREGMHKAFIINKKNTYIKAIGKEEIATKLIKEMLVSDRV